MRTDHFWDEIYINNKYPLIGLIIHSLHLA